MAKPNKLPPGGKRPNAGRKRGVPNRVAHDLAAAARQYSDQALTVIHQIMANEANPAAVRLQAAMAILDRSHGKPTVHMNVDLDLDVEQLTDDELTRIIRAGETEGGHAKVKVRNGSANRPY